MRIYIGADHRGFKLKEQLKRWLVEKNLVVEDTGAYQLDLQDDYPVISENLGKKVISATGGLGILLCGSGVGASAAVNKIDGIRGAIGISEDQVRAGRHDDDMNVLVLPADEIDLEQAEKLVRAFISTPFVQEKRYQRRLQEIKKLEEEH